MDIHNLGVAFIGLFLAGVVKGVSGIGYTTAALPFLVLAVGLKSAMALVLAPAIVSNIAVMIGTGGLRVTTLRFAPFYIATIPGIALGAAALTMIDVALATKGLAVVTMAYVGLALAKPDLRLPSRLERPLAAPAGLLNGLMTGLTGSQILPLMPYMMSLGLKPAEQVQAINLAVAIASTALGAALLQAGIATPGELMLSVAGIVPAIAGVSLGTVARNKLPVSSFKLFSLCVLAIIAMSLLAHAPSTIDTACGPQTASPLSRPPTTR